MLLPRETEGMAYGAPRDYSSMATEELEAMARRSSNAAEQEAISAELSRRYASMYRPPSPSPAAGQSARPRPQSFSARAPGPVNGPNSTRSRSWSDRPPASGFNQQPVGRAAVRINHFAVASLTLAVLWIFWWGSLAGIILGVMALRQIRERNQRGRALAIAGILIGSLGFLLLLAALG